MVLTPFNFKLENMCLELTIDSSSKGNSVPYRAIYFAGKEGSHFYHFKRGKCSFFYSINRGMYKNRK